MRDGGREGKEKRGMDRGKEGGIKARKQRQRGGRRRDRRMEKEREGKRKGWGQSFRSSSLSDLYLFKLTLVSILSSSFSFSMFACLFVQGHPWRESLTSFSLGKGMNGS